MEKYFLRLKHLKDQLLAAGETVSDNDLIVASLVGLPAEYNMIRIVIVARESPITLKEFRDQLLSAEKTTDDLQSSAMFSMAGMFSQGESSAMAANRSCHQGASYSSETLNLSGGTGYVGQFQ